jgi:dihydrofolate synthase/folylpolyglutamate synthase
MTYQETINYLFSQLPAYHRLGKAAYKNDLQNSLAFDEYLSHPHNAYRTIHIAGTNGKGSVSHMTASILMEAGFRTGLYTSPHLKDFRERIRVNGEMISKKAVIDFVSKNSDFLNSIRPSFFEMTVAMAFQYFRELSVDAAVIEVGLGGRLDSTNIITPVLSVITNIGHDHMDLLGDTPEKIAFEKAGVIKKRVPVIIGETQEKIIRIFTEKACETGSVISFADQNFRCALNEFDYSSLSARYSMEDLVSGNETIGTTPLGGDYQAKNLQTIFQIFSVLRDQFKLTEDNLTRGVERVITNTGLAGRWQVISRDPLTICDTGHNMEGLEYVTNQLRRICTGKLHIVIGFVNDKDLSLVLPLLPKEAVYYFTKASVPRAMDEKILYEKALSYGLKGLTYISVRSALNEVRRKAFADDLIFIGGSTFIVSEAL